MPSVKEYVDRQGRSPFGAWHRDLPAQPAAKVAAHLVRLGAGNWSNVKPVGEGVHEKRIDWGPGLRVYFGNDGAELVILLAGSGKDDQAKAIRLAQERWKDYRKRK